MSNEQISQVVKIALQIESLSHKIRLGLIDHIAGSLALVELVKELSEVVVEA